MAKHITAFIHTLGDGGAQGVFVTVMNYYIQMGYSVTAVVESLSDDVHRDELDNSITVHSLDAGSAKESLLKMLSYFKKHDTDIAFGFSPELTVNLVIARKISRKTFSVVGRCINTLSYEFKYTDSFFRRFVTRNLVKIFYHKADLVVAQAIRMKEDLVENFGFSEDQVITINNPLSQQYKHELDNNPLEERDNSILYAGRLEHQKGLDLLIKAFAGIDRSDIKLILVGQGSMVKDLEKQVEDLGIDDRVLFVPYRRNIVDLYRKAKATVLSSYFEGFPNVLIESLACGTPVVAFDLPSGPSDIIINGVNGFLVNYLDIEDLTYKIQAAVNAKWDYTAVKNTARRFCKEDILTGYMELLDNLA